jgi:2,4-dienoyl-CoA reductase-like NADH-dependent reductase (Old Yellow Enzyme family)
MTLFDPLRLRGCDMRNRIVMSPMSQHQADEDGLPKDWHLVHYGSRAVGGCGAILLEDTAVMPEGRTSHAALGCYDEAGLGAFRRIVDFCHEQGAAVGVQLSHAGRKAFRDTRGEEGSLSASPVAFAEGWSIPAAADARTLEGIVASFARAAGEALEAGFDFVEVHAAHGYLFQQFLSPLTNLRDDGYGGSLAARARLLLQSIEGVRLQWPEERPLLVRLPAGDGATGGSMVTEMAEVAGWCAERGVDLIDVAGGTPVFEGTRVSFEEMLAFGRMLRASNPTIPFALGGVTDGRAAEELLRSSGATLLSVGRALLANPNWAWAAASELGVAR